jgi:hypothetical protein
LSLKLSRVSDHPLRRERDYPTQYGVSAQRVRLTRTGVEHETINVLAVSEMLSISVTTEVYW